MMYFHDTIIPMPQSLRPKPVVSVNSLGCVPPFKIFFGPKTAFYPRRFTTTIAWHVFSFNQGRYENFFRFLNLLVKGIGGNTAS